MIVPSATWGMPFRPFFLAAALLAVLAIPLWLLQFLHGLSVGNVGLSWHIHEMLSGFAATVVLGFVLTAIQTWTGQPTITGPALAGLFATWCLARLGWMLPAPWTWLGAGADFILFATAGLIVARLVYRSANWRNAFFAPVFLVFALFSPVYLWSLTSNNYALAHTLHQVTFYLIIHLILVVGGRVIPFFSDRRLARAPTPRFSWLEAGALGASLGFIVALVSGAEDNLMRGAAAAVATLNLLRWLSWRPWQALALPLLWSLYLAYFLLVTGFALMAFNGVGSGPIHLLAIGGMGLMILAMISRVSLGHTGRELELPGGFAIAFLALVAAALLRVGANYAIEQYALLMWSAAVGWMLGFGLFLGCFVHPLLSPRPDGKPG